jgi:DNA repair exonuclease SbcCD ATPase subunit
MPYIKNLRLKNFKNYIDEYFEFSDVNVFYGDNGSGKSGVIQALVQLLTNKSIENIGDYKRTTADSFTLEANFLHDNLNHYYEMTYDTASSKVLKIDGMPKPITTASAITKKMAEIITGDLAVFSSVSLQGDSSKIFTADSSDTMTKIKKILQLDKLTKVSELLKIDQDVYTKQLEEFKKDLNVLENSVYEFLDEEEPEDINEIEVLFQNLQKVKILKMSYDKELLEYNTLKSTYDRVLK